MMLRHIKAFGSDFSIDVHRNGDKFKVVVANEGKVVLNTDWDGTAPLMVGL